MCVWMVSIIVIKFSTKQVLQLQPKKKEQKKSKPCLSIVVKNMLHIKPYNSLSYNIPCPFLKGKK